MRGSGDLPFEIWQQIYDYVPKSEAIRLYGVNRHLYHIVLSEKYAHVRLDCYPARPGQAYPIRNTATTKYIQTLTVSLVPLIEVLYASMSDTLEPPAKETQLLLQKSLEISALSPSLPALRTLTIMACGKGGLYHRYLHFKDLLKVPAGQAMQSVSYTLRALDLRQVPLEFFRDELISTTLVFPLLEEFHMDIFTIYDTTDYAFILQTHIAPFVNRHSASLERLEFKTRDAHRSPVYLYSVGKLFQRIAHIPGLTDLSVRLILLLSDSTSLDELGLFIHAHSGSLLRCRLYLYHTALDCLKDEGLQWKTSHMTLDVLTRTYTLKTLLTHPLFSQTLPSCNSLKDLSCFLLSEDALQIDPKPFLSWFPIVTRATTLTTLSLPYNVFPQSDLIDLVSVADLSALWRLRVKVQAFNMSLFDAFAVKLPSLQELAISAHALLCSLPDGSQVEWTPLVLLAPYSQFLSELRACSYVQWRSLVKLSMIIVHKRGGQRPCKYACCQPPYEPREWVTEEQIQVAFPHIQHFEGKIQPFET